MFVGPVCIHKGDQRAESRSSGDGGSGFFLYRSVLSLSNTKSLVSKSSSFSRGESHRIDPSDHKRTHTDDIFPASTVHTSSFATSIRTIKKRNVRLHPHKRHPHARLAPRLKVNRTIPGLGAQRLRRLRLGAGVNLKHHIPFSPPTPRGPTSAREGHPAGGRTDPPHNALLEVPRRAVSEPNPGV